MSITLRHAAACYQAPDGEVEAVRDVSFTVEEGAFVSLVGPSGCGKSTLLSAIAGLEPLSGGVIEIDGRAVQGTSPKIGFMPQRDQLFEWRNIWDNVTLGLTVRGEKDPAAYAHVSRLLERYGLASFAKKRPCQLSGGMRQRCALIRTLATEPEILLLDEPFSALDYQTRLAVSADIWRILRQEGKTALLVTHDIAEAVSMSRPGGGAVPPPRRGEGGDGHGCAAWSAAAGAPGHAGISPVLQRHMEGAGRSCLRKRLRSAVRRT